MPPSPKRQWRRALSNVLGWLLVIGFFGGIAQGFRTADRDERAERELRKATRLTMVARAGAPVFVAEVVDPHGVLDYVESQRPRLELLLSSVRAHVSTKRDLPSGPGWQADLIQSHALRDTVVLEPPPVTITWNRAVPPPLELNPIRTVRGIAISISAGGLPLATFDGGEVDIAEQPIPPDAALPRGVRR